MEAITIVTGNPGKLAEWKRLFPDDFEFETADIDLDEIQSLDLEAIVTDKVERAYAILQKPVIVEDISAGLDNLHGMPGPFIKFFEQALGRDALFTLSGQEGDPATAIATVAYYDGKQLIIVRGEVKGTVTASRGTKGFGFDANFVPNGQSKTYGEMELYEKDVISHRGIAINELVKKLRAAQL